MSAAARLLYPPSQGPYSFDEVLPLLRDGARVYREAWTEKGKCVLPRLYVPARGTSKTRPWRPSRADLLANDWRVAG